MNERIKQFAEEAKAYANEWTKYFTGDEPVVWMDYYTEKFARLIIEDCVGAAERAQADSYVVNRIYRQFEEKRLYNLQEPGYNVSTGCKQTKESL
jgi:hypothetical protein